MGGHWDHTESVGVAKLLRLCSPCSGHPREAFIQAEVVLIGDRSQCFRLVLNRDRFFRFEGLVLAIAPTTPGHDTAGALINNHHFLIAHHVIHIAYKEFFGIQCIQDEMGPGILGIE